MSVVGVGFIFCLGGGVWIGRYTLYHSPYSNLASRLGHSRYCSFDSSVHTVRLTSIDHPPIEGGLIRDCALGISIFLFASGPPVSGGPDATIGFDRSSSDG